jgi:hypothetical protein
MEPNPSEVAPWYLRNINQALALDSATGNVYVRTNAEINFGNVGNIIINDVGVTSLGNVDISGTTMPVSGNVTVYQGTDPWHIDGNVTATVTGGNIEITNNPAQLTAFAEPLAIAITPVLQYSAEYGLNPDEWNTTQLNSGNITVSNSVWNVQSGTSAGGYARLATSSYVTYKPGQGSMFRWTAAFTTTGGNTKSALGIDNIPQTTGPIDREDGYAIGYSGSTVSDAQRRIGFLHRRNGLVEIRQLTVTTAPTGTQTATITLNGVAFNITLTTSTSTAYTAQQIAALLKANPVAGQQWDIEACDSIVTFAYYSPGAKTGTYSFSSTGAGTLAVATFSQVLGGATPNDTWIYVDAWDNQDIAFDPTKLNVFGLDLRWLGAGIVRLFMEDPATGQMVLMHTQRWSSTSNVPHIRKPSLRLVYRSGSTSGATPSQNVVVSGSSVMGAIQGVIEQTTGSQSWYSLDTTTRAKDTVWHLMSIQNPLTRGPDINKSSLVLQDLSVSAQGNDPSIVYVVKNCVGTNTYLLYQPLPVTNNYVFAQYANNTATENLSQDTLCIVQSLGINGAAQFNLLPYNLTLSPGDSVSVFISSTNAINRSSVGLTWKVA